MPNTLLITRSFPPVGSTGASIRVVKLMKYLARQQWNFIVLTQHPDHTVIPEKYLSSHMLAEIPAQAEVFHIPAPFSTLKASSSEASEPNPNDQLHYSKNNLSTWISKIVARFLPGSSLWWGFKVLGRGYRLCKQRQVDIIFTTAPPFTNALIGTLLRLITRKPLVLEFRDDWVDSPDYWAKSTLRRAIDRQFEKWIIGVASQVIFVTEDSFAKYRERYAGIHDPGKFHYIPNGCDLEEFRAWTPPPETKRDIRFTILCAAWGLKKDYRDFSPFLCAFSQFLQQHADAYQDSQVILLGSSPSHEYDEIMDNTGIRQLVRDLPAVQRTDFFEWLWRADMFFLIQPSGNTTSIAGTLYEYWAIGKAPILLIADEGACSKLIKEHHLGQSFQYKDIEGIANYISELYQAYKNHSPITISSTGIEKYDRRSLALQMEEVWLSCLPVKRGN